MINKKKLSIILVVLAFGLFQFVSNAYAHDKGFSTGFILSDSKGNILLSQNKDKQFIPASILKILTSLAAIQILGPDYHFSTEYKFDKRSKNLYVRGKGDPLFISEEIARFCKQISLSIPTRQINNIILDNRFFSEQIHIPGKGDSLNPYDAIVGALCANFNTINFRWDSQKNCFISGEPQTPLLSIFNNEIQKTNLKEGRIVLTEHQSRLYPGFLIKYFLEENNIQVSGNILLNENNNSEQNLSFLSSYQLTDVIKKLLEFSNNFIANQLLLTLGASQYGEPATLDKGINVLKSFADDLNLKKISIFEGSGLSRSNRISPEQMQNILIKFMPYFTLLKKNGTDYFKTGTLTDVRTRAGYITGKNNTLYPYTILVNQKNADYTFIHNKLIKMVGNIENDLD
ncbi:MAG: D-alanyl-D-alanine carboxypeptidase [Proteobacteria bacterium]|nr:D-alanyl-D-alanine carboxypeptidase [Pseudomonadota bacterium]MBU1389452.1 D-alanyl-D-alanine carboxypeptidase [Pseudomonadota bacterium]MBU1541272.1 D-alanyl-D-alanine carboxypeptidase [Pseudomonadota bacterium]MBU2480094.1 D-alanyl-D-alanine carboxypeptidase [Pseudomonadota bacterium]